jgi:hypothetical protein
MKDTLRVGIAELCHQQPFEFRTWTLLRQEHSFICEFGPADRTVPTKRVMLRQGDDCLASSRFFRVRNVLFEVIVFPRHVYIAACRGRSPHQEKLQNGVTP